MSASQNNTQRWLATAATIALTAAIGTFGASSPAHAASSRWCSTSGTGKQAGVATCHGSKAEFYAKATCQKKILWWTAGPTYTRTGPKVKEPHSSMAVCNAGDVVTGIRGVWVS